MGQGAVAGSGPHRSPTSAPTDTSSRAFTTACVTRPPKRGVRERRMGKRLEGEKSEWRRLRERHIGEGGAWVEVGGDGRRWMEAGVCGGGGVRV